MNIRIRKAMDGWNRHKDVYQMNLGNNKRWYWVHERNMEIEGPLKLQQNLFNAMLAGLVATVKGSYDRKAKKLSLKL